DVYARFSAMLDKIRKQLSEVTDNADTIIEEVLDRKLIEYERYIHKGKQPPLNPKEGDLWLDTSHDGVAVLKRYENGEWIKSSVDDVKDIGGMTREETMYEALKERLVRNEVDYSEVFKRHGALVSEKHYHYVDDDTKNDLTNRYNALQQSYDDFKVAFNNINSEQPTIGLITTAISRAVEFEARLKEYNDSYYVARKSFDEVIALLQSQYSDEKYNELLNDIADSVGGIVNDDGSIDMSEVNQKRLDEAMELVASAIGGTWNGNQLIADVPNREELDSLNQSIKQYLNGELDSLDGKLGKQIETVVNQAKDEFSVAIDSVEKKVDGIEVGGRNLIPQSNNFSDWTSSYRGSVSTYEYNIKVSEWGANNATKITSTGGDHQIRFYHSIQDTNGKTVTWSICVKNVGDKPFLIGFDGKYVEIPVRVRDRLTVTKDTRKNYTWVQSMVRVSDEYIGEESAFVLWKEQAEFGTIATDWTPAPEDFETYDDYIMWFVNSGKFQLEKDGIYGLADDIHIDYQKYVFEENNFSVYNAGNVEIEPESMYIDIIVSGLKI